MRTNFTTAASPRSATETCRIMKLFSRAPAGVSEKARKAILSVPGVVEVERMRARMVGATHFIEAIVKVPRTYPIDRVDEIKQKAQQAVTAALGNADLTFTGVPVALNNESVRERIMVIARNAGLAVHHVTVHDLGGKLIVSSDLDENVDAIERALRRAFPTVKRVISHAEPPYA